MRRARPTATVLFFILLASLESCVSYSVIRSENRGSERGSIDLTASGDGNEVTLSSTGEVDSIFNKKLTPFFPASFLIEAKGKTIYIDPIGVGNGAQDIKRADYILITHPHADHFSIQDIDLLSGPNTTIICPRNVVGALGNRGTRDIITVEPGQELRLGDFTLKTVPAYNERSLVLGVKAHPKNAGNVGYIIHIHGIRLYHTGDTDVLPFMQALTDIDVLLVPLSGSGLTMTREEAATLANRLKPRIVVPMHYDLSSDALRVFQDHLDAGIRVADLRSGGR